MKIYFYAFLILFSSGACSEPQKKGENNKDKKYIISFIKLISNPEIYDKKNIVLHGYYSSHIDEPLLFMDKHSYDNGLSEYSLPISDEKFPLLKNTNGTLVYIAGKFSLTDKMVDPSGSLHNIQTITQNGLLLWERE